MLTNRDELIFKQHTIASTLRSDYNLRLDPKVFTTREALSPRWVRLPFGMISGETFEAIKRQERQIAHCVGADYCEISLDAQALWVSFPRPDPQIIYLKDALQALPRPRLDALLVPLGVDMQGEMVLGDLSLAPHVLIVGTSGSGKTVLQNVLITSLACWYPHHMLHLILCDGKGGVRANDGFGVFGHPQRSRRLIHLTPFHVLTEIPDMIAAINWLVALMEKRQHEALPGKYPRYVLVIDELADIIQLGGALIEEVLQRLLWKARSAGIHVVAATAKADKNSLGGLPSLFKKRAVLTTVRASDSYLATNVAGSAAHLLLMNGDMLWGAGDRYEHLQGFYVSDTDTQALIARRLVPNTAGALTHTVLPPPVQPRGRGRPQADIAPAEIDAALAFLQAHAPGELTQRYVATGKLTGTSMGGPRAQRLIDTALAKAGVQNVAP